MIGMRAQRGFTFIEAAIVIVILAVINHNWDDLLPSPEEEKPAQQTLIEGGFVAPVADATTAGQRVFRYQVSRSVAGDEGQPEVGRMLSFAVQPADKFVATPASAATGEDGSVTVTVTSRDPGYLGEGELIVTDQSGVSDTPLTFSIGEG